jgi:hypothetical protein
MGFVPYAGETANRRFTPPSIGVRAPSVRARRSARGTRCRCSAHDTPRRRAGSAPRPYGTPRWARSPARNRRPSTQRSRRPAASRLFLLVFLLAFQLASLPDPGAMDRERQQPPPAQATRDSTYCGGGGWVLPCGGAAFVDRCFCAGSRGLRSSSVSPAGSMPRNVPGRPEGLIGVSEDHHRLPVPLSAGRVIRLG